MKIYVQCIDKESLVDMISAVRSRKTKNCEGPAAEEQQRFSHVPRYLPWPKACASMLSPYT